MQKTPQVTKQMLDELDFDALSDLHIAVKADVQFIQAQLSMPMSDSPLSEDEYWKWRSSAKFALAHKVKDAALVGNAFRKAKARRHESINPVGEKNKPNVDIGEMLKALVNLGGVLSDEGIELYENEQKQVDDAKALLSYWAARDKARQEFGFSA